MDDLEWKWDHFVHHGGCMRLRKRLLAASIMGLALWPCAVGANGGNPASSISETKPERADCVENEPELGTGVQAWMSATQPEHNSNATLCVRFSVYGEVAGGASITATVHFLRLERKLGPVVTRGDGIAELPFNLGDTKAGESVMVDVRGEFNGQISVAQIRFTPR